MESWWLEEIQPKLLSNIEHNDVERLGFDLSKSSLGLNFNKRFRRCGKFFVVDLSYCGRIDYFDTLCNFRLILPKDVAIESLLLESLTKRFQWTLAFKDLFLVSDNQKLVDYGDFCSITFPLVIPNSTSLCLELSSTDPKFVTNYSLEYPLFMMSWQYCNSSHQNSIENIRSFNINDDGISYLSFTEDVQITKIGWTSHHMNKIDGCSIESGWLYVKFHPIDFRQPNQNHAVLNFEKTPLKVLKYKSIMIRFGGILIDLSKVVVKYSYQK